MGLISVSDEYTSPVPPVRFFKALVLDSVNLLPKLLPQVIKSIETIHGDGGIGTIKKFNFVKGNGLTSVKHRVEEVDPETFSYNYTLIEGDALNEGKLEKVCYEVKFEASSEGGTIAKMISKYYTINDASISEEEIKAAKEKAIGSYKAVEAYLLQNPDAYA